MVEKAEYNAASIRPQRIAADHNQRRASAVGALTASIRPQRIAADHRAAAPRGQLASAGFNKAAANRCGSQGCAAHPRDAALPASIRPQRIAADHTKARGCYDLRLAASIRPQRIAADHPHPHAQRFILKGCFNKAAANRCGSRRPRRRPTPARSRFNKAAANRCGSLLASEPKRSCAPSFNKAAANRCGSHAEQLASNEAFRQLQ